MCLSKIHVQLLMPSTCECTLIRSRLFADVVVKMRLYWIKVGLNQMNGVFIRRGNIGHEEIDRGMTMLTEIRVIWVHKSRNGKQPQKLENAKDESLPTAFRDNMNLLTHSCPTSCLQKVM